MEETQRQKSRAEIQEKYRELLHNLIERMPNNKDQVIRSLNKAFQKVFPQTNFEDICTSELVRPRAPPSHPAMNKIERPENITVSPTDPEHSNLEVRRVQQIQY